MDEKKGVKDSPEEQAQLNELKSMLDKGEDFKPESGPIGSDESPENSVDSGAMIAGLLQVGSAIVASRQGDHWNLTEKESVGYGANIGAVLDKHMPSFNSGPEAALILSTIMIFGPRLAMDVALREEKSQEVTGDGNKTKPSDKQ